VDRSGSEEEDGLLIPPPAGGGLRAAACGDDRQIVAPTHRRTKEGQRITRRKPETKSRIDATRSAYAIDVDAQKSSRSGEPAGGIKGGDHENAGI
jgi:hypothetical protein